MTLHRETITDEMERIVQTVFVKLDAGYYLAGGTALALQLGHRKSIDLDYFISQEIDTLRLRQKLAQVFEGHKLEFTFEEKNTLWCAIDGVKVSFISRFDILLDEVTTVDAFRLIGMSDITVMKLSAICGREEYKDYFDLACISKITDVRSWISWWTSVYPNADPTSWVIALGAVGQTQSVSLDILSAYQQIDVPKLIHAALLGITKYLKTQ